MIKKTFLFVVLLLSVCPASGLEVVPKPEGRVNDYANVIPPDYLEKLQALIAEVETKTSAEIAVVTMESIAPYDEVSYARLLFDNWKIGKKGKDNGVLVLLAVRERRWRIETGYGVEGILPDGKCGEIGRSYMVPLFKQGKYGEGLYSGTAAIADVISRDSKIALNALEGVDLKGGLLISDALIAGAFLYAGIPLFFFVWNLLGPVIIGLPFTLLFVAAFLFNINRITGLLIIVAYICAMLARYIYWRKFPAKKRPSFFGPQSFGNTWTSTSGGWGRGGGGFGGGGFGGGMGGGGGSGGGF